MKKEYLEIIKELESFSLPKWDSLPDLDLYMNQMTTYLNKILKPLTINNDKLITTSMINNYVKAELLPAPDGKKYTKDHLTKLLVIGSIKQILSISETGDLLFSQANNDKKMLYQLFLETQKSAVQSICTEAINALSLVDDQNNEEEITNMINIFTIKLAIDAQIRKILAEKLLDLLNEKTTD